MTDDAESIEPKAQLAKAWETRRSSRCGVKLAVEPRELLRPPEPRGEVPLEALGDFPVPEAALGILTGCGVVTSRKRKVGKF